MFFHVLRFRFRDEVSEADREEFLAELRAIEEIAVHSVGQLLNAQPGGYTHVYCTGFASLEAMEPYFEQPGHREVVARFADLVEKFDTIDFSDDMDPGLSDRMNNRLAEWMKPDPALSDRLVELGGQ